MSCPSIRTADVASTSPRYELGKVPFNSRFLKRKKSQRFGASSFSKFHHMPKKIPLPPLGRSYSEQKNHFAIGRYSEHCSYHTDLSRFVLPISDPSALNFSQFVGFQNSPYLNKIEKVAETCEFDGKEPLFVERTISISIRVLRFVLVSPSVSSRHPGSHPSIPHAVCVYVRTHTQHIHINPL